MPHHWANTANPTMILAMSTKAIELMGWGGERVSKWRKKERGGKRTCEKDGGKKEGRWEVYRQKDE